jgi:hypothetical protein
LFVLPASDLLAFLLKSVSIAFPFSFSSPRLLGLLSPADVHWRRNVCSRGEDVLSVIIGFIPIRGSNNGKKSVVSRAVVASKSGNSISNGGLSTQITFAVLTRCKRKSTERVPTTSAATVSSIPTTCGATRLWSENIASG